MPTVLQWSRRVNTAEWLGSEHAELGSNAASMEPPCEHGGVPPNPPQRLEPRASFNGAAV